MSTKQQTNSTESNQLQFNPQSLGTYGSLQGNIGNTLNQFMQNPLTSSFFNQRVGMGNKQISQMQAGNMQSFLQNFKNQGFTGAAPSAFLQSNLANMARGTSALKSNNFMSQLFNANQMQLGATGLAQSYQPLFTGSNSQGQSTQMTSGTGTWLPQLLGSLGGAALGGLTGGLFGGGSSSGGFQPSDINSLPTNQSGMAGTVPGMFSSVGPSPTMNPFIFGQG